MKPLDRLPSLPEQAAFLRLETCIIQLQPFMSEAEYMAVRTRVCQWDLQSDPHSYAVQEGMRRKKVG